MRIHLIICPAPFLIDEKVFPPLGLLAVGTALRVRGHDVTIGDAPNDSLYFGLGPTTPEYASALAILRRIKNRNSEARVVIGGPHAEANPEECLADGFDMVAIGDGENITPEMFKASGIVDLGRKPLDQYPIADRSLVDIRSYRYEVAGKPATTLMSSRGCPYRCGFCAGPQGKVRYYSSSRIEQEIRYLKSYWGFNALMFFDDTFTSNAIRVRQVSDLLRMWGITWRCFVRGDLVVQLGQGVVDIMSDSGCAEVAIGIESASDRILKIVRKGEDATTMRKAISMLRLADIRVKGLFMVGLPGENRSSLAETRQFIQEVPLDDADFTIYQPYRGSPIWDNRQDYDISWQELPTDQRWYKGRRGEYKCAVNTSALTSQDIVEARDGLDEAFREILGGRKCRSDTIG